MIERYLTSRYADGGRGPVVYDCWGLTRAVRHEVFGLPLLPSYGAISPDDKASLTHACRHESQNFTPGPPVPGAIVTVWQGRICTHVAVCVEIDGRLAVLETGRNCGPRWLRIPDFERRHLKVIYHHDRDLSLHSTRGTDRCVRGGRADATAVAR